MRNKDYVILIDIDEVISDLLPAWVDRINSLYSLNVDYKEITEWGLDKFFPQLTKEEIYAPLIIEDFWLNVKPVDGSVFYLKKLIEDGFTVKICTASCPQSMYYKYKHFISKYFPFITYRDIICTYNKQLIKGNILLDDHYDNLIGGSYRGILFTKNHNKNIKCDTRISSWKEFYEFIQKDYYIHHIKNRRR